MADMTTKSAMVILRHSNKSSSRVGSGMIIMMTMVTIATAMRTSLYFCTMEVPFKGSAAALGAAMFSPPYNFQKLLCSLAVLEPVDIGQHFGHCLIELLGH